jgi:hypothetical protein
MNDNRGLTQNLLQKEAEDWRILPRADYDRDLCGMLDQAAALSDSAERATVLMELASAVLQRNDPTLTESRARVAMHLLALLHAVSETASLTRIRQFLLLAWQQLGTTVASGPESISVTPDLPPGVVLPNGADPSAIVDPALRKQAQEAVVRHREAVELWNAKQRALGHLGHLAALVRRARVALKDHGNVTSEMLATMASAPGISSALPQLLEDENR